MRLKGTLREKTGSRAARALRESNQVPATVYSHGDPASVALDEKEIELLVHSGDRMADLEVDGRTDKVLIKEVQIDVFGTKVLHADFKRVSLDEKVRVSVALKFTGVAKGQLEAGVVDHHLVDLEVECLARDIPESITIPIAHLELDQAVHVGEIALPPGVRPVLDPRTPVVSVRISKKKEAEVAAPVLAEGEAAPAEGEAEGEEPKKVEKEKKGKEKEEGD